MFRKRTYLCGVLLQHISKFISLFDETPFAELIEYICLTDHGGYIAKKLANAGISCDS